MGGSQTQIEIFDAYIAGVNAKDIDAVTDLFADEVRTSELVHAAWGKPGGSLRNALRGYITSTVINMGGVITVLGVVNADSWVYGVIELRSEFVSGLGIDRIRGIDELQVQNGLITAFQFIPSVNDEQTKVFNNAVGGGNPLDLPGRTHKP